MSDPAHTEMYNKMNNLGEKLHEVEKESIAHDNVIDVQLAEMAAHQKEINKDVARIEKQVSENAAQVSDLKDMHTEVLLSHKEVLAEHTKVCDQMKETTEISLTVQSAITDLKESAAPAIKAHNDRLEDTKDTKRRWRDRGSEILGYVGGGVLLSLLFLIFRHVFDFLKSM